MSLTNDQITAKNFKEFYEAIRPYLNGNFPTPIVNKFDKANMYSTDEQIVGRWIDGKPLYQKTFDLGSQVNMPTSWSDLTQINHTDYDMDVIVDAKAIKGEGSNTQNNVAVSIFIGAETSSNYLIVKAPVATSARYITLQYTKTTDTAMDIGSDTDYSTTEKIVGTWIDGKPIYQRVFDLGSSLSVSNNAWTDTGISIADNNIDRVIFAFGLSTGASNDDCSFMLNSHTEDSASNVNVLLARANGPGLCRYFVLQYTKTTD